MIRRLILALALSAGITPAFAQAPSPVPALPDTERRTSYSISASTCTCTVNFAVYGDSTDYQNWIEVFLNGTRVNFNDVASGWTITSPSGPISTIPRPITDAVLTFNSAQTGTVQIVGSRRPRRTSQFSENQGVSARSLNQAFTDIVATQRETWDRTNDVTGRAPLVPAGESLAMLPSLASRQNKGACFDSGGNLTSCVSVPSTTIAAGTGITITGTNPATIATNFAAGTGITLTGSNPITITAVGSGSGNVVGPVSSTAGHIAMWANSAGTLLSDSPTLTLNTPAGTTTQGFNITQSGPASGNQNATINFNSISVTGDAINTGSIANTVNGLSILQHFGGTNAAGAREGLFVNVIQDAATSATNPNRNYVGIVGVGTCGTDGGTGVTLATAKGGCFGGNFVVQTAGVNWLDIVGQENDVQISTPGSAAARSGIALVSTGNVQGSLEDSAVRIIQAGGTIAWKNAISLSDYNGGVTPLSTTGCVICTNFRAGPYTITTGIDLSALTISGNFLKGPGGFGVSGSGVLTVSPSAGSNIVVGGNVTPQITFFPTAGATKTAQFYQQGDVFRVGAAGIGDKVTIDLGTGQLAALINIASTTTATGSIISAGGIGAVGAIYGGAEVVTGAVAVASLPACGAARKGARHFVTDANATFTAGIGAVVAAGGANNVPVTCDGTSWRIGANDNIPAHLMRKFA